jgi:hypothetical protein
MVLSSGAINNGNANALYPAQRSTTQQRSKSMKTIQSYSLKLLFLAFASFSGLAHADTITGKMTTYQIYSNANGDSYSVRIGAWNLYAAKANGELLREAFLRKLTVTVNYAPTSCLPNPACGYISTVTIQSIDVP